MSENSRRDFLKQLSITTAATVGLSSINANAKEFNTKDAMGVLVDVGVCVGCRNCERACQEAHNLPTQDPESYHNREVFKEFRRPDTHSLTVVNQFDNPNNKLIPYDVKYQCMHCNEPACVSACIVGAFTKHKNGAVTWDTDKCIGCRYCMVACPFQIPTFEYDKALQPRIMKCDFCFERTKEGLLPACVANCPVEAITYGPRDEILQLAKKRIKRNPEKYIQKIFGEDEVGGTSWLYIAPVDFEKLMFPKLGDQPAPGVTEAIQHGIFSYFIPPLALFGWLGGVMWLSKRKKELLTEENNEEENK
ncbi:MAG: 4Fe-4S dicluster domain-containing protein [Candidatus Kapaibacteriota bacterium]